MENPYLLVLVTTANNQEAEKIAQQLLEARLIACANILGPVSSHFHWSGKIEKTEEYLLLLKSRTDLFEAIIEKVKSLHSYETPEILALPITKGSKDYLSWLDNSLK